MKNDCLQKAKCLLSETNTTCVLCNQEAVITDNRRGIRPLLDLLENNTDVTGYAALPALYRALKELSK